ncbi:MAG: heat-inducible transcriptional repressor HrcA [Clostridia bacterium]|nr:heat-inducible transcriptional repressor HrcA [Clostridia bacterium]
MEQHGALSDRKKQILKAIIDVHIRLGEPVGSKFLTQNEQISLSSATIRNEMAELEEMGYLRQPHTSAGRIPSRAGYRLYVDSLMNRRPLSSGESEQLDNLLKARQDAFGSVLEQAGKMISSLTGYAALTMKNGVSAVTVKRFDGVWIDSRSFILVMTLDRDSVRSKTVHMPVEISDAELKVLMRVLNDEAAGLTMDEINLPRIMKMETALGDHAMLLSTVIKHVYSVIGTMDSGDIRFEGVNRLLDYPEFSDIGHIRELFGVFENKDEIASLLTGAQDDQVNVIIGSETNVRAMENAALVFRTLTEDGRSIGALGVIGPLRMDYARVVGVIEYMAKRLEDLMNEGSAALPDSRRRELPGT